MQFGLHFIAQMDYNKYVAGQGTPDLSADSSYAMAWVIAAVLTAGILLITFKTSKRNHLERE
jgi:hypothetical protein